ncbi:KEOPS complex subunit Pcc1 [Methanobacterium aggregans]|uniref:KEOPS complex subunit Pcc1 n=1 Tax=Methanobacterium aggregans TaxID=1615586 RepID=UPI001AE6615A|nr:KEOPS complex subunit Pcc1 [Methanobacterium aggregans]
MEVLEGVETELEMEFDTPEDAEIILKSIEPEIHTSPSDRASVSVHLAGSTIRIKVDAEDATSLRASLNSYLRWTKLSYEILELRKYIKTK